jgi:hypothetical protein
MAVITYNLSIWMQLANFFFTLAGLSGDLLIIRLTLFTAYSFTFLNAALGGPLWGSVSNPGFLNTDIFIWGLIGMYVHGASLVCLFADERKIVLTKEEEALWRVFYRTGGLSALLFKTILCPHLEVVEFKDGEDIPTDDYFYVLYTGYVKLECMSKKGGKVLLERLLKSGDMFDLNHLDMFRDDNVLKGKPIICTSLNNTTLYRFTKVSMDKIAHHPLSKGVWQSLLIHNLSSVVEAYMDAESTNALVSSKGLTSAKIFQPLQPSEEPNPAFAGSRRALEGFALNHILFYIKTLFSPPTPFGGHPTGIRQTMLPTPKSDVDPLQMTKDESKRFERLPGVQEKTNEVMPEPVSKEGTRDEEEGRA